MDFRFTSDQLELAEGARSFLDGVCPPERLRSLEENKSAPNLWNQIVEMGLVGALVSEKQGGLGLGAADFVLVAEATGRVALPEPLIDVAVAAYSLSILGDASVLDSVLQGAARVAIVDEHHPFVNLFLPVEHVLVLNDGGVSLVPVSVLELSACPSIDPLRNLHKIDFAKSDLRPLATGKSVNELINKIRMMQSVFTSAQLLGLTDGMIQQATEYAKSREQFGVPIGSFQAVKHNLANAFVKLEFAKPVLYRAAAALDVAHSNANLFASQAKLAASDAAIFAAETAIQVHGAMGYTYEVDLHYWMKRAWALAGVWGDQSHHTSIIEEYVYSDNDVVDTQFTTF